MVDLQQGKWLQHYHTKELEHEERPHQGYIVKIEATILSGVSMIFFWEAKS